MVGLQALRRPDRSAHRRDGGVTARRSRLPRRESSQGDHRGRQQGWNHGLRERRRQEPAAVNVSVKNRPPWIERNGTTKVVLERMPDGAGAVSAPAVVSSVSATVTCQALTVAIDWSNAKDGYAISLTPP